MLTPEMLAAIRERAELAGDAPFSFDGDYIRDKDGFIIGEVWREPHGEFFAHACQDIPQLLGEIERLQMRWDALKEHVSVRREIALYDADGTRGSKRYFYGGASGALTNVRDMILALEKESDALDR